MCIVLEGAGDDGVEVHSTTESVDDVEGEMKEDVGDVLGEFPGMASGTAVDLPGATHNRNSARMLRCRETLRSE